LRSLTGVELHRCSERASGEKSSNQYRKQVGELFNFCP
jgi:hypothetical protein